MILLYFGQGNLFIIIILSVQFKIILQKTPLGSGFYLSSDLNISLSHSHGGFGWGASSIGGHLSCIAMCEVIDTPDGINYKKPVTDEGVCLFFCFNKRSREKFIY